MFTFNTQKTEEGLTRGGFGVSGTKLSHPSLTKSGVDFLFVALIVVNVASLLALGGLYFWRGELEAKRDAKKAEFDGVANDPSVKSIPLAQMQEVSAKINAVSSLIDSSPYMSGAFPLLEKSLERNIKLKSINLTFNEKDKRISFNTQGVGKGYSDIIIQRKVFSSSPYKDYISGVSISKYALLSASSEVEFDLSMSLKVNYGNKDNMLVAIGGGAAAPFIENIEETATEEDVSAFESVEETVPEVLTP